MRNHAVEAQLDPQFSVLEAAQADSLLIECCDAELREALSSLEPDVLELTVLFGLDPLRSLVLDLAGQRDRAELVAWRKRSPLEQVAQWEEFFRQQVVPAAMRRVVDSARRQRWSSCSRPLCRRIQNCRSGGRQFSKSWRPGGAAS